MLIAVLGWLDFLLMEVYNAIDDWGNMEGCYGGGPTVSHFLFILYTMETRPADKQSNVESCKGFKLGKRRRAEFIFHA